MRNFIWITLGIMMSCTFGKVEETGPTLIANLNLDPAGEPFFDSDMAVYVAAQEKVKNGTAVADLADRERIIYNVFKGEGKTSYWSVSGANSWYKGQGGAKEITASSTLHQQGDVSYAGPNAEDHNFKTVWIEGASGDGTGEYLLYKYPSGVPRITSIIVANGYVMSESAYTEYARVKRLKVYLNDRPYAIFKLDDVRSMQFFTVSPIESDQETTLKFEIADVYKGTKYDDVAISEIYFNSLDGHL